VFTLSDIGVPAEWLTQATNEISWRDLILIGGRLFLIAKSAYEIRKSLRGAEGAVSAAKSQSLGRAVAQIALLDLVFSLDSLITTVGMARQTWVMAAAILLAMGVNRLTLNQALTACRARPQVLPQQRHRLGDGEFAPALGKWSASASGKTLGGGYADNDWVR
jgi:predicted tellurium resistance membrane protein TerC